MPTELNPTELADTAISVAAHLEAELEEALAEHRLTRPSFLVLDALDRAEGGTMSQRDAGDRGAPHLGNPLGQAGPPGARPDDRAHARSREPPQRDGLADRPRPQGRAGGPPRLCRARRAAQRRAAGRLRVRQWPTVYARGLASSSPTSGSRHRLGVAVAPAAIAKRMRDAVGLPDEPGVLIVRVGRESAAEAAGLARGDLITHAGGEAVLSIGDLHRAVRTAGGSLALSVLRGAERRDVEVALSASSARDSLGQRAVRLTCRPCAS